VKVRGFFMRLIRVVADLRPRCIVITLGLIHIMGCAIPPGPGYDMDFKMDFMWSVE